jgi:hypothetical protein
MRQNRGGSERRFFRFFPKFLPKDVLIFLPEGTSNNQNQHFSSFFSLYIFMIFRQLEKSLKKIAPTVPEYQKNTIFATAKTTKTFIENMPI